MVASQRRWRWREHALIRRTTTKNDATINLDHGFGVRIGHGQTKEILFLRGNWRNATKYAGQTCIRKPSGWSKCVILLDYALLVTPVPIVVDFSSRLNQQYLSGIKHIVYAYIYTWLAQKQMQSSAPEHPCEIRACRRAPARCAYHSQVESLVVLPSLSRCPRRRQRKQQGVGGPH